MMSDSSFEEWSPIEGLPQKVDVESVHDDYEGFRVIVRDSDNEKMLRIFFHMPLVYRKVDEGDRWDTINKFTELQSGVFFKVSNSDLAKWLEKESCGIHEASKLTHYLIAGCNDIIDVISEEEPIFQWL